MQIGLGGTSMATMRRVADMRFATRYIVGQGIDIGSGHDPLLYRHEQYRGMTGCDLWDRPQGDAQLMPEVPDNKYDFVHASHVLEHMNNPVQAIKNWTRILKPGGYLIVVVPEWEMYEATIWPSRFNDDHKYAWTLRDTAKQEGPMPQQGHLVNMLEFVRWMAPGLETHKLERLDAMFNETLDPSIDQTRLGVECGIEWVARKAL